MKKSVVVALHLGFWMVYVFLLVAFSVLQFQSQTMDLNRIIGSIFWPIFGSLLNFYAFYFYVVPDFLIKRKTVLFVVIGLTSCLAATVLTILLSHFTAFERIGLVSIGDPMFILLLGFIGILSTLIKGFITWYSEMRLKEELAKKNLESQLSLLKAQINPHFLFNTLNNIDVLIEKDAKAASEYLKKLSDILRFMLYETPSERVLLQKELEYIVKYVELQKLRTRNNHFVDLSIRGNSGELRIAPMIFIPFIENAFKHSSNKRIENAIDIKIDINDNVVLFTCNNVFDELMPLNRNSGGLGIDLLRQRLNLLYNKKHELSINNDNHVFRVSLRLLVNDN
jgi:two-component system, LytTR family, sensor kinase